MTRQYHVLPAADRDLDEQAAYLAANANVELALRFYDAAASRLGNSPTCLAWASGGHRPTHAWSGCNSRESKVSRIT